MKHPFTFRFIVFWMRLGCRMNFTSLNALNHVTHRPNEPHRTIFDSNHPQIRFEFAHRGRGYWSIESIFFQVSEKIMQNSLEICIDYPCPSCCNELAEVVVKRDRNRCWAVIKNMKEQGLRPNNATCRTRWVHRHTWQACMMLEAKLVPAGTTR